MLLAALTYTTATMPIGCIPCSRGSKTVLPVLVFLQGFRTPEEVATFGSLMQGMAEIVVNKYDGSLKVRYSAHEVPCQYASTDYSSCGASAKLYPAVGCKHAVWLTQHPF